MSENACPGCGNALTSFNVANQTWWCGSELKEVEEWRRKAGQAKPVVTVTMTAPPEGSMLSEGPHGYIYDLTPPTKSRYTVADKGTALWNKAATCLKIAEAMLKVSTPAPVFEEVAIVLMDIDADGLRTLANALHVDLNVHTYKSCGHILHPGDCTCTEPLAVGQMNRNAMASWTPPKEKP